MRFRLLTVLAAAALTLSLLGPTGAEADDPSSGPSLPDPAAAPAQAQATEVLDQAQALFEEKPDTEAQQLLTEGGPDATMVLLQLARVRPDLSPSQRRQADALLARPTRATGRDTGEYDAAAAVQTECATDVCVHWVDDPEDAPPAGDADADGVPDSVAFVLQTAQTSHDTYVSSGYRGPDSDGTRGSGTGLTDVYLADLGDGAYGYTQPEGSGRHGAGYIVIDNDFAGFGGASFEDIAQVTVAHEYFHAVQFAYDYWEDLWVMEATATWAEDEVFDDVDDNRQYLRDSQLKKSRSPLDRWTDRPFLSYQYGNWIFFRYLTERWPEESGTLPTLVLDLWKKLSARGTAPDMYSTQAIQKVLAARGTSFRTVYGQFADANRRPETTYEEGAAYPKPRLAGSWTLTRSKRTTGEKSRTLDHLTSLPLAYRPGDDLTRADWRLRLKVDMPGRATAPVARVARYLDDGSVQTSTVRLRKNGTGTRTLGFSDSNVDHVELVLVNASRRTRRCQSDWSPDYFACFGFPRDNNLASTVKASIFRP